MSFREKSAWVMGAIMLIAGLNYLVRVLSASSELGWSAPPIGMSVTFTVVVVIASIIAQTVLAVRSPKEAEAPADERERPLVDRAGNWSGVVLGIGVVTSLLHFFYHEDGVLLFHMVMGSLILAQIAEYAFRITLLRRSL